MAKHEATVTVANALAADNLSADATEKPSVAAVLRKFAPEYIGRYCNRMPPHHRKVLGLIIRCKTGGLGNFVYRCESCSSRHWVGRSCGNRHCPNCQKEKTQAWLAKQRSKLLPVQHFVVTFTVPKELRSLLRSDPEAGYAAIFEAGSETIRTLLKKPKNLGSDKLGFFGVLHTWGRDLKDYHPHVHFVVPGGGVSPDGSRWLQVNRDQLFHPHPAKLLYKKLFVAAMRKAGLYKKMPPGVLKFDWVVNIKPVGNGAAVLKYLAPYIYRVAICDNRIVSMNDAGVTYQVKPSGKRVYQTRHLSGESFVRAFAQHILPPGFQKVRYYGFMSPNSKLQLATARWLVWLWKGWTDYLATRMIRTDPIQRKPNKCGWCGGRLELLKLTGPDGELMRRFDTPARGPPQAPTATRRRQVARHD